MVVVFPPISCAVMKGDLNFYSFDTDQLRVHHFDLLYVVMKGSALCFLLA